jgi:hypothetical protein
LRFLLSIERVVVGDCEISGQVHFRILGLQPPKRQVNRSVGPSLSHDEKRFSGQPAARVLSRVDLSEEVVDRRRQARQCRLRW